MIDIETRFNQEVAEHQMTILRDDGLYRHLRFQKPETSVYYFDLVTWPGNLVICGDMGSYHFARLRDMFKFFGQDDRINPDYWSEKLQAPQPDGVLRFSEERYRERVEEWIESQRDSDRLDTGGMKEARRSLLEYHYPTTEHEAYEVLREFRGSGGLSVDFWEWNLRDYDTRFLWCCWAIVWGIHRYRMGNSSVSPE